MYKLKENPINIHSDTVLCDYLLQAGVATEDVENIIDPKSHDELDYNLLSHMDRAIELLQKHIEKKSSIFLVVDSDADGYTSAAIIYQYIKHISPDTFILPYIHAEKEHGVVLNSVPPYVDLVIIPDAGSNQEYEVQCLNDDGKDVLILDHHIVEMDLVKNDKCIIINSQLDEFPNPHLSGAGVTFKFVQAFDEKYYKTGFYKELYDLAALGIVSDMMWSGNKDNNYIIRRGLNNIKNSMFKALVEIQAYSLKNKNPNKIGVAFYITPLINAVIRYGDMDLKTNLFMCFADPYLDDIIEHEYRGKITEETVYQHTAREATNARSRQNKRKEKIIEELLGVEESDIIDNYPIIILEIGDDTPPTLTGLIASQISNLYKKPTLIVRRKEEDGNIYLKGSGRALKAENFNSFKDWLSDSGLVEYASGHHMAFGVSIPIENRQKLLDYAAKNLADVDFGSTSVEVDYIFDNFTLNLPILRAFAESDYLYGNGIPEPIFAFELLANLSPQSLIGKDKTTVKFSIRGITFLSMKNTELAEMINERSGVYKITAIGTPSLNEWQNRYSVQVLPQYLKAEPLEAKDLI